MKIIKKSQAQKIIKMNQAVKPVAIRKYDLGKYEWSGSQVKYIGRDVKDLKGMLCAWVERRQDSHGPYAQVMCASVS